MYDYIKGKVADAKENTIVIENNGIGYELNASTYAISELSQKEGEVKVYCKLCVREDDMSLFGFYSLNERAMFLKLIEISGVGPKLALTVLSGMSVETLALSVVKGDVKALSKVKGVGKKTAERIILELKDKVNALADGDNMTVSISTPVQTATVNEEAVSAIMTLGYTKAEATDAVLRVQKDGMSLEEIIFKAIKNS